jgi:threonine dehydrogenase-like Zn-dependent dehydrogenase
MPIYHPHKDEHGKLVELKHPSKPTPLCCWADAAQQATVIPGAAAFKQVRICFPLAYSPEEFCMVADLRLAGRIDPKVMITETIAFAQLPDVFEQLRAPHSQTNVHVVFP